MVSIFEPEVRPVGLKSRAPSSVSRFEGVVPLEPDFVAVLGLERTGVASIAHTLKQALGHWRVIHARHLDGEAYRTPANGPGALAQIEDERYREARIRAWLAAPQVPGVVFTVVRDPAERIASALWADRGDELLSFYDRRARTFGPQAEHVLASRLEESLAMQANFARDVWLPLGLPARPGPGVYGAGSGRQVLVLDFAHLAEDFAEATAAVFGHSVELPPSKREAARHGDFQAWRDFRRYCARLLQARGLDAPG